MKRKLSIGILAIASLAFATQASALALFFDAPSTTTMAVGDTVTIDFRIDTEGETQVTSIFVSVIADPAVLQFTSGTSPGQILFNTSTFEGVARVSQPVDGVGGDAPGRVRAANFATATPTGSGVASANQLLATLTFTAVGAGAVPIQALVELGTNPDEVTVATVSVAAAVTVSNSATITVPEPSSVAMGLVALGTIAVIKPRRSSNAAT